MEIFKIAQFSGPDNSFTHKSTVELNYNIPGDKGHIDLVDDKVIVDFKIELGYRSWGIDSAHIYIPNQIRKILVDITQYGEKEDKIIGGNIEVDIGNLKQQEDNGQGIISVGNIYLVVDQNLKVDYNSSYIIVHGI